MQTVLKEALQFWPSSPWLLFCYTPKLNFISVVKLPLQGRTGCKSCSPVHYMMCIDQQCSAPATFNDFCFFPLCHPCNLHHFSFISCIHNCHSNSLLEGTDFDAFIGIWELDLLAVMDNIRQQIAEAALKVRIKRTMPSQITNTPNSFTGGT